MDPQQMDRILIRQVWGSHSIAWASASVWAGHKGPCETSPPEQGPRLAHSGLLGTVNLSHEVGP